MRRFRFLLSFLLCASVFSASPAFAQQSVNLFVGGFVPHGEDSRVDGDVIFNDQRFFRFDMGDFNGPTIGGEWLIAVTPFIEAGLGVGIYSQTANSTYADLINEDGSEIEQRLKLRMVPWTASFRVLPAGRERPIQPYVGAGVAIISWKYSETGDFVDFDSNIFHDRFEGSGTSVGPLVFGGVRVPAGVMDFGFEVRYQGGEGEVDPLDFAGGRKVDLGGFGYLATFNIRF